LHRYYQQIATRYDRHKQCYVLNFNKVKKLVAQIRDESDTPLVVDSHIAHHLHQNLVDLCIVLTCSDLQKLKKRLQKRRYSTAKIEENLQAEIFQVCLEEAREQKHKILLFNKLSRENIARRATIIKKSSNERRGRHLESAVAH